MPQLIIRADHTVKVSAPTPAGKRMWQAEALLTVTASRQTSEATSPPCPSPDEARAAAVALVRAMAGFSQD